MIDTWDLVFDHVLFERRPWAWELNCGFSQKKTLLSPRRECLRRFNLKFCHFYYSLLLVNKSFKYNNICWQQKYQLFQQAVRHCVSYRCSIVANKYDCTRLYIGYCYEYIALQDVCRSLTENTSRKIYLYDMILGLSAITKNPTDTTHNSVLRVLFTHSDEMRVFFPI